MAGKQPRGRGADEAERGFVVWVRQVSVSREKSSAVGVEEGVEYGKFFIVLGWGGFRGRASWVIESKIKRNFREIADFGAMG